MANTLKVTLVKSPIGAVPKHKLTVKVNAVSETAKAKIDAAGGTVEVI